MSEWRHDRPEAGGRYLVTADFDGEPYTRPGWLHADGGWYNGPEDDESWVRRLDVLAWMPMPEPWEPQAAGEGAGVGEEKQTTAGGYHGSVRVDPGTWAVHVKIGNSVHDSVEVAPGVIVDYDRIGRVVGVEVLPGREPQATRAAAD